MKKSIALVCSAVSCLLLVLFFPTQELQVVFCDVGQADTSIVMYGSFQIVIDVGKNELARECLEQYIPFWDRTVEVLVLTHMDADHIRGFSDVSEKFDYKYIFINPSNKKTTDFSVLETVLSRKVRGGSKIIHSFVGQQLRVGNRLELQVITPRVDFSQVDTKSWQKTETTLSDSKRQYVLNKSSSYSENDLSIGFYIKYDEVGILFTGDLEGEGELSLLHNGLLNKTSIIKAGHHGSKTSSKQAFLEALQPEVSVVSSGKNNQFGHPHSEVMGNFTQVGAKILQTQYDSDILIESNGTQFWRKCANWRYFASFFCQVGL